MRILKDVKKTSVALATGLALGLAIFAAGPAVAQYPERTITLIVPFAPGSVNDQLGRLIAEGLKERLGQTVVVINQAGAGGRVGAEELAVAAPDGYTLMTGSSSLSSGQALRAGGMNVGEALRPIALYSESPVAITVNNDLPVKTVGELVAHSKTESLNYGTAGVGSINHLGTELFLQRAGMEATHVPYPGGGPAMTAMIGGEVDFIINDIGATRANVDGGLIRRIAVANERRVAFAPDTPTLREEGIEHVFKVRYGLFAPAGVPDDIVTKLNQAVNDFVVTPAFREVVEGPGGEVITTTPDEFARIFAEELQVLNAVVDRLNLPRQ